MKKKVLIDSDTGLDDAMAFVHGMLSDDIEIIGVTSAFGNAEMIDCAYHALEIIELMGKKIPVVKGATDPLISGCGPAAHVHGQYGRGPLGKQDRESEITPGYAAIWMLEQIRKYGDELTIVAMGRLTNIAIATRIDPELMRMVGQIYWLGGAITASGNTSPVAEANVDGDAEAAKIVCTSKLPLTILTLDVSMNARISDEDVEKMKSVRHPGVQHLVKVLPYYIDYYETIYGIRACAGHVGLLLALVMDPTLIKKVHHLPVDVETKGELTRSMLVVDRRKLRALSEPDTSKDGGARIVVDADTDRYHEMFMNALMSADKTASAV
ncbi:nucleoside hydrolase [Rhizobium sp. BK376]|uniref:nucleoside hydrolase n=1 Tax=Rhizobium sp. BK376 TaxID=2512149 RepID=UPI0010DB094D|nr:nucleoside hydrolase [Rhizobium sp. BK376]TCR73360.1 inosine-uridine nucleoside N-ribohydrolase [Rhizobium sp. BK376]